MGPMIAIGGIIIESLKVKPLEEAIDQLCLDTGFPETEVFKWSPRKGVHWMRENLVGDERRDFQIGIISLLKEYDCNAIFLAEDKDCSYAEANSESYEMDIIKLLVERVDWCYGKKRAQGIIICDRPSGNYKSEEKFLAGCLETVREGTTYLTPSTITMAVLSCPYKLSRLLQAADLITSCTLASVCGEERFSPTIIKHIKPLFLNESGRIGGVGVKLHPFPKYVNLYHWLFDDEYYVRYPIGCPLPMSQYAFSKSPNEY